MSAFSFCDGRRTHDLVAKYYPAMIDQESVQKDMEAPIKELHKDIKNFIK